MEASKQELSALKLDRLVSGAVTHSPSSLDHVSYWDGWRGLAIGLVLQDHFLAIHGFDGGRLGVDIFFVLSGVLMGNILFVRRTPLKTFYKRRASRVGPAFLLFVLAIVGLGYVRNETFTLSHVLATLTFTRTYLPTGGPTIWQAPLPIGHLWSLNVEEHAYVIMSLLTLVTALKTREWLPLAAIGIGSIAMQIAYIYVIHPTPTDFDLRTECAVAPVMLSAAYCQIVNKRRPRVSAWAPFGAFILACFCYTQLAPWWSRWLVAPFLLAFAVNHLGETWTFIRSALSHSLLRLLGIWSFSIYLWQQPFFRYKNAFPVGGAFVAAMLVALFSFYVIENPTRAYLNRRW